MLINKKIKAKKNFAILYTIMWRWLVCSVSVGSCLAEKVLIIGAGGAGMATASRLLENNISDFRILEAEQRIGGRIHSFFLDSAFVDIGAQSVHGEEGNAVYEIASKFLTHSSDANIWVYYGQNGSTDAPLFDQYISIVEEITDEGPNVTMGDAFSARYRDTTLEKYKHDPKMLIYSRDLLRVIECLVLKINGPFRWFKLASKSNFRNQKGDKLMSWNGQGYKTIFNILLEKYSSRTGFGIEKQLSLGKTVIKIILMPDSVRIKCRDGSEYVADHVVFTPSLGVLKHDHKKMFKPRLSKTKTDAINKLGFDGVVKFIIQFPNAWWGSQEHFFFVWPEQFEKQLATDIPFGPIKNGDHWLSWFCYIEKALGNSRVLIGWIFGPMVPEIEKLTEQEMATGITYAIKKFLGKDYNVTYPSRVIHSKWIMNPNFRGTYSYETIDSMKISRPTAQETLSTPIVGQDGIPRIFFAGEATSPHRFKTVDGAIETGYREADRLIKILNNDNIYT